ncbi:hypothetical protein [Brachyspira sp.]|uniref:hypothetical protein n=1 Tax=Brachyspira sp. TaxID=1977261 RepID=UPI003D7F173D
MSLINNSFKIFLISLLSLTLLFSISCSNEGTTGGGTRTLSYYAGNWFSNPDGNNETHLLTINSDGSLIVKKEYNNTKDTQISSTSITRNSDTSYTFEYYDSSQGSKANITLTFSSDTQGTFTGNYPEAQNQEDPLTITKK